MAYEKTCVPPPLGAAGPRPLPRPSRPNAKPPNSVSGQREHGGIRPQIDQLIDLFTDIVPTTQHTYQMKGACPTRKERTDKQPRICRFLPGIVTLQSSKIKTTSCMRLAGHFHATRPVWRAVCDRNLCPHALKRSFRKRCPAYTSGGRCPVHAALLCGAASPHRPLFVFIFEERAPPCPRNASSPQPPWAA